MTIEMVIWEAGYYYHVQRAKGNLLILRQNIEHEILLMDQSIVILGIDPDQLDFEKLSSQYQEFLKIEENNFNSEFDNLKEFFTSLDYDEFMISNSEWCVKSSKKLIYDTQDKNFFDCENGVEIDVFRFWDGHTTKVFEKNDEVTETNVKTSSNFICLDEWNGTNKVSGGVGLIPPAISQTDNHGQGGTELHPSFVLSPRLPISTPLLKTR